MSYQAYQSAAVRTEDPRLTEYRLFGQVTRELIEARDAGSLAIGQRAEALDRNRRMWAVFAGDCGDEANGLPESLRAAIISLSIFVDKESRAVMRGESDFESLIEINRTIMQGLAPQAAAEPAESA
ncbi:flagellar biosynthesis regulatory protein FlaF [Marinicauda salina]|jgi:flagellar protein FlaF|uniref:Flagellar biosynthesis regulatory protein FlaF n=1 Tax=Marinicauda salina TaxID=2135793 RepID=A0A2U2BU73_9PROT|nr:flagellar biosynthesis regulator FlaF [Marinicauda salina]PWE17576.1 flagellar biosynthesis regulatory protein FlaF [Marinicauda salina]